MSAAAALDLDGGVIRSARRPRRRRGEAMARGRAAEEALAGAKTQTMKAFRKAAEAALAARTLRR